MPIIRNTNTGKARAPPGAESGRSLRNCARTLVSIQLLRVTQKSPRSAAVCVHPRHPFAIRARDGAARSARRNKAVHQRVPSAPESRRIRRDEKSSPHLIVGGDGGPMRVRCHINNARIAPSYHHVNITGRSLAALPPPGTTPFDTSNFPRRGRWQRRHEFSSPPPDRKRPVDETATEYRPLPRARHARRPGDPPAETAGRRRRRAARRCAETALGAQCLPAPFLWTERESRSSKPVECYSSP